MSREDNDFLEDLMNEFREDKKENSGQVEIDSKPDEPSTPKRTGLLQMFSEEKSDGTTESLINDNSNRGVSEEEGHKENPVGTGLLGKLFGGEPEPKISEEVTYESSGTINSTSEPESGEKENPVSEVKSEKKPKIS